MINIANAKGKKITHLKFEVAEKKVKTMLGYFVRRTTFIMSSYNFYAWYFCRGCYGAKPWF